MQPHCARPRLSKDYYHWRNYIPPDLVSSPNLNLQYHRVFSGQETTHSRYGVSLTDASQSRSAAQSKLWRGFMSVNLCEITTVLMSAMPSCSALWENTNLQHSGQQDFVDPMSCLRMISRDLTVSLYIYSVLHSSSYPIPPYTVTKESRTQLTLTTCSSDDFQSSHRSDYWWWMAHAPELQQTHQRTQAFRL
jgi:hypothetical protein